MTDLRFLDPNGLVNRESFNERFGLLNNLMNHIGDEYLWEKLATTDVVKVDLTRGGRITSNSDTNRNSPLTFTLYPSVEIVDGVIKLTGEPRTITGSYNQATQGNIDISGITDYYGIDSDGRVSKVSEETLVFGGAYWIAAPSNPLVVAKEGEHIAYLNSSDPNAYPPAVDDGFAYNRLGQLGGFAKIATGSYVGTGTYGSSNPTKINLPFDPKFILIASEKAKFYSGNSFMDWAFWFPGMTHLEVDGSSYCNTSIVDEQFRCYNDDLAYYQFNKSNWIYHYLIVG